MGNLGTMTPRDWKCNRKGNGTQKSLCWSWDQRILGSQKLHRMQVDGPHIYFVEWILAHKYTFVNVCPLQVLSEKIYILNSLWLQGNSSMEYMTVLDYLIVFSLVTQICEWKSQIQHFPVRIHLLSHYLFGFFQWLWSKHIDILFTYVCVYSLFYIFTFTFILIFQIWLSDQKVYIRKFIVTLFVIIQIWKIEDIQVVNIIMTITLEWLTMYLYKLIILHDNISSVWKILMNLTIIE